MTAQPLRPPIPPYLQVGAKAASTAQSSQLQATASTGSTPGPSRSPSQVRPTRVRQNEIKIDHTSEAATLSLIRRVLSHDASHGAEQRETPRPIEDLLPPLTSFNEVDVQLYAIIAIVLRDYVYTWYSKITPDHVFVEEVVQIIAHCSRALEQRLRRIDVDELILDEIPALLEQHVQNYQTARQLQPSSAYASSLENIYHEINPHPALSPLSNSLKLDTGQEQLQNEALYRQLLVQGALAVLLPTEDLDNECLRTLVGDILADLILGQGISDRACEGWFVHDAITRSAGIIKARLEPKATGEEIEVETRGRLEKFGLLSSRDESQKSHSSTTHQSSFASLFWRILQYLYLMSLALRFTFVGLSQARYRTPRSKHHQSSSLSEYTAKVAPLPSTPGSPLAPSATAESMTRPIMEYRIFDFISTLLDLSTRMPWLVGMLSICQHFTITGPGRISCTDALLDKFLSSIIRKHVLPPTILPPLLLNLRIALFPGNARGPPAPEPPSAEERLQIRRRAAQAILSLIPPIVARSYFNASNDADGEQDIVCQIEDILDVFGNAYLNKHLVYNILELVIVRLVPELRDSTPSELLSERGVS